MKSALEVRVMMKNNLQRELDNIEDIERIVKYDIFEEVLR